MLQYVQFYEAYLVQRLFLVPHFKNLQTLRYRGSAIINPIMFLVRHGKTGGNQANTYRSWSNGPDAQLTPEGRDGIRQSALFLQGTGIKFPLIISDDLDRSKETREILQSILDIRESHVDKRLRPLNVGDFIGKSKADYPLDKYIKNRSLKIPGGESLNQFDNRQAKFFDDVAAIVQKLNKPILIVGHGSTVSFLHNTFNSKSEGQVGYEGLVYPSGVLMFTSAGVIPLTNKREGSPAPLKDGTPTSGFVTDEENVPPRECWHCKFAAKDINGLLGCTHPVVRIDPKLQDRLQSDGTIAVGERDCCDMFSSLRP